MTPNEAAAIRAQIAAVEASARTSAAQSLALFDVAAALKRLLDQPPAPPPPTPAPPPPVPPPPPPPPEDIPAVFSKSLNPDHILMLTEWLEGGGVYDRDDRLLLWKLTDGKVRVQFRAWSPTVGDIPLMSPTYRLFIDGVQRATVDVAAGATKIADFLLDLADISEGYKLIEIAPLTATPETCVPGIAYMQRGVKPEPQTWMYVVEGTHTARGHWNLIRWAKVPARDDPTTAPYPFAPRQEFSDLKTRRQLIQRDIAPYRHSDVYRARVSDGVMTAEQMQGYYWNTLTSNEYPAGIAVLDGPRGVGTITMATHLQIGRNGGVYFCDPWRVGHIQPDGTIKTLAGWRHRHPAERPLTPGQAALRAACELVGDWSAIPPERHGFHEAWGMAWDVRTVAEGTGAPVDNPPNGLERPHDGNPVAFVADSQRKRVCRLEFDGKSHAMPVKVTEFLTGLNDPWDVVCVDGVLYVSIRLEHRIAAFDAKTGAFIRDVVRGNPLAALAPDRSIRRLATEARIKAEPCVAPEGLYHLDGWLYFGSYAAAQIKRVHLVTGELQTCVDMPFGHVGIAGGNFFKIAVSDGTFGPRGTIGWVSWALANGGRPYLYAPDAAGTTWSNWNYMVVLGSEGPGVVWDTLGYGSACAIGKGRVLVSTSAEGLHDIHAAAGEPVSLWADQERMRADYEARGLHLTHGPGGWGYYGLPLPWGASPLTDRWMELQGL